MKLPLLFFLLFTVSAHAVLIPADRLFNWTPGVNVGVQGGITHRSVTVTVTGADPTGVADSAAAIQAAIDACAPGGCVFIPAGTYKLASKALTIKPNTTLRGAGRETTILKNTGLGMFDFNAIGSSGEWGGGFYGHGGDNDVTAGFSAGSTVLTIDDTSVVPVGSMIGIMKWGSTVQTDNPLIVATQYFPGVSSPYPPPYKQKFIVTAKTSSTITVFPPVFRDMSVPNTRVTVTGMTSVGVGFGIEDMTLDCDHIALNAIFDLNSPAMNWWVRNIRLKNGTSRNLRIQDSLFFTIRDSVFDTIGGGSPNGSGIELGACGSGLIENNVIIDVFPCIEVNNGSSGNVVGYNYAYNNSPGLHAIMSNHNTHNFMNLYEGNVANGIVSDGYYGSASHDTIFRNWLHGKNNSYGVLLCRFTRSYNVIGNVIGGPDNVFGYDGINLNGVPFFGGQIGNGNNAPPWPDWGTTALGVGGYPEFDTMVRPSTNKKGNYNFFNDAIPASEALGADTLPNSLYLTAKPAWFGNLAWPPINPQDTAGLAPYDQPSSKTLNDIAVKIPAGFYAINGVYPTAAPDTTPPSLVSKTITAAGTTITFAFNENVAIGLGGNGGWTINMTGGAATLTYASGSGTSNLIYNISRVIAAGQTGTVSYVQPGNGVEDVSGNDLASLSNSAVTNTAAGDTSAPIPNPSTFGIAPTALTSSTITMTATTSTDTGTPPVSYFFNETSGNAGGSDSGWQSGPGASTFTDSGLAAGTQYRYRVQARDSAVPPNVTTFSQEFSATTKSVAGAHPAMPFKLARANIVTP